MPIECVAKWKSIKKTNKQTSNPIFELQRRQWIRERHRLAEFDGQHMISNVRSIPCKMKHFRLEKSNMKNRNDFFFVLENPSIHRIEHRSEDNRAQPIQPTLWVYPLTRCTVVCWFHSVCNSFSTIWSSFSFDMRRWLNKTLDREQIKWKTDHLL